MTRDELIARAKSQGMDDAAAVAKVDAFLKSKGRESEISAKSEQPKGAKSKEPESPKATPAAKAPPKADKPVAPKASETVTKHVAKVAPKADTGGDAGDTGDTGDTGDDFEFGATDPSAIKIERAPSSTGGSTLNDAARKMREKLMANGASFDVAQRTVNTYMTDPAMVQNMRDAMGAGAPAGSQEDVFVAYANFTPAKPKVAPPQPYRPAIDTGGRANVADLRREDERAGANPIGGMPAEKQKSIADLRSEDEHAGAYPSTYPPAMAYVDMEGEMPAAPKAPPVAKFASGPSHADMLAAIDKVRPGAGKALEKRSPEEIERAYEAAMR